MEGPDSEGGYHCYKDGNSTHFRPDVESEFFVARFANDVSDWVCETLADAGRIEEARNWPLCPRHIHSLDPQVAAGIGVWRCRDDTSVSIPIGALVGPWSGQPPPRKWRPATRLVRTSFDVLQRSPRCCLAPSAPGAPGGHLTKVRLTTM